MVNNWKNCSTPEARVAYLHMYAETDFSDSVKGLKTPILVITGEHDSEAFGPLICSTFLNWYPNAKLQSCPSGHFPMQETPAYLASQLEKFLSEHSFL